MQVLQWLSKVTQDPSKKEIQRSHKEEEEPKELELVSDKHKRGLRKSIQQSQVTALDCRNLNYITLLLKRENIALEQRRLSSLNQIQKQQYILSMKMKKEDIVRGLGIKGLNKPDSNPHHVSNKVLPITDATTSTSSSSSSSLSLSTSNVDGQQQCQSSDRKEEKVKAGNQKNKTLSRMKELLRWAAAAKLEKGGKFGRKVLHFRNKSATIKSGGPEEQNDETPKLSFRWEVESCSTTCSAASAPPSVRYEECSKRRGSWITTDDDFVVLEL